MVARPLVSVLLPVRDGGTHLAEAVRSVLDQTYRRWELVVVDDRSTDTAVAELPADSRIRVVANPGRGIVDALNAGARAARGELLARMDADDIALPDRLLRQVEFLERFPGIGIAGGQVEVFVGAGPPRAGYHSYQGWINGLLTPEQISREIFVESPIPHPTAVIRRGLFERLGGYRNAEWAEDYDLWLRAHLAGIRMGKPRGIVLRWRDHHRRLSRISARYSIQNFIRAKAYYLASSVLAGRKVVIWGGGPTGRKLYDALSAHGAEVEAFIDVHPRRVGGRKRGVPVLPVEAAGTFAGSLIVGAVGSHAARAEVRQALVARGRREGSDFLFAA